MENYYSLQESDLLHEIIKAIKRNEHGLLDFVVQDILRDQDLRSLINREIEIEKDPEEPEKAMVIKIDLSREGVPDNTFRLYLSGTGTILIDWGDGTSLEVDLDTSGVNFYEHQYENVGNYTVKVYGQEDFPEQEISFGSGALIDNYYNRSIEEIVTWGDLRLVSLSGALSYTMGPSTVPNNLPETVTNLSYLLRGSTVSEVINIQDWNTSNVTNMSHMFREAENFNGDLSSWDTSSVTNMRSMFARAISFVGDDISDWNTGNVREMGAMFSGATSFNWNIGGWNTENVRSMSSMFFEATSFNQDIGGWNTESVEFMNSMFHGATEFNQNIGGWNTSRVVGMISMFNGATKFDQDLSGWCVKEITSKPAFFDAGAGFEGQGHLQPDWGNCPS